MRHARNFNPEWAYVAPAPSRSRTDCLIVSTLTGSGAITSIVPVTASIAAALAGGAAARFPRSPNPKFFANADRCAA